MSAQRALMAARCVRRAGPACALAAWLAGTAAAAPRAASPGGNHPDLWNFTAGTDGASPRGDLIVDAAGNLYGTTSVGGSHGAGSVFMATPSATGSGLGSETTIYDFTGGADGSLPTGGLVADSEWWAVRHNVAGWRGTGRDSVQADAAGNGRHALAGNDTVEFRIGH